MQQHDSVGESRSQMRDNRLEGSQHILGRVSVARTQKGPQQAAADALVDQQRMVHLLVIETVQICRSLRKEKHV